MFHWLLGDGGSSTQLESKSSKMYVDTTFDCEGEKIIEVDGRENIFSAAFLPDGNRAVGGGDEQKIRHWDTADGMEVGQAMDAGSCIRSITSSQDGKWIVSGAESGSISMWSVETHKKVLEFTGHCDAVCAVDISPDGTKIVTGSDDATARIWSTSAGKPLFDPLEHQGDVSAVKFSPDGQSIATATYAHKSVRVYDSHSGILLLDVPVQVYSSYNETIAWFYDNRQLLVLSKDRNIYCLDLNNSRVVFQWLIHPGSHPRCMSLATNHKFIAASNDSTVSFWDVVTHEQIGPVIEHPARIYSMDISNCFDLIIAGGKKISIRSLHGIIPLGYLDPKLDPKENDIQFLQAQNALLEKKVQDLSGKLTTTQLVATQDKKLIETLREHEKDLDNEVTRLEQQLADAESRVDDLSQVIRVHEQKSVCENLYAAGRIVDASTTLLVIINTANNDVRASRSIMKWLSSFTLECIEALGKDGDEALLAGESKEAAAVYSAALSLRPSNPRTLLVKWASAMLTCGKLNEASSTAIKFRLPKSIVYEAVCEALEKDGRIMEAVDYFHEMRREITNDTRDHEEQSQWNLEFQTRVTEKLEKMGDIQKDSQSYEEAINYYSAALTFDSTNLASIVVKRGTTRALKCLWNEALQDANKAIELDPSSYTGYEVKYDSLKGMGHHGEAFAAFAVMLSKMEKSSDPLVRHRAEQFVNVTCAIRNVIWETISHMPRVVIDAATGYLCNKTQLAAAFEQLPIYDELRCSMTTHNQLDKDHIRTEAKMFYRYVTFSHKWEDGEPLFQHVENTSIYGLELTSPNIKLQMLCNLVRSLGFRWVWSDTCCIDKKDVAVLQESLVAMFTWYRGSSLTIVHLRGVRSESQEPGHLWKSIWNTRVWTYQEYVAATTVQFYTEDWKPYLGLDVFNHKESPAVVSEMERTSGGSIQSPTLLRPGLERIREKLSLASMRETTLVEDIAYSLLGIFNVSIPVIYGEGNRSIGRLLEHVLTRSGNVTILAWTGHAGDYHSCLPPDLRVYHDIVPRHIPHPLETVVMDSMVSELRLSLPEPSLAASLYGRLNALPLPCFVLGRLQLPGIIFPVSALICMQEADSDSNSRVYLAKVPMLGDVKVNTTDDLSGMEGLVLIHPWIGTMLHQELSPGMVTLDDSTQALRLLVHLRQPFGALLLAPILNVQYRRVAADCLIMAQMCEGVSSKELIHGVRMVDVQ